MSGRTVVLSLAGITKRFASVAALTDARLDLRQGSVHALLGENGAGKTTLMRIAYGMLQPDSGVVVIDGLARKLGSPAAAIRAGIGMVHQHFTLSPAMTVAENVGLGGHGRFHARAVAARVRAAAADAGLAVDPGLRVSTLSVSAQQRVEIVKALTRNARILVLDEPTSVLAPDEADDLLRHLRAFADAGRSVILITHKLREALAVADEVTVLRRGATVLSGRQIDVTEQGLLEAMIGEHTEHVPERDSHPLRRHRGDPETVVISARDLSVADGRGIIRVRGATFDIAPGEIVGVAAVEGSGHHELLRAIAGRRRVASGVLRLPSTVGFVPDDRQREALVPGMSLTENRALRGASRRRGRMSWREVAEATASLIVHHDIRAPGPSALAGSLSGGNQQKFVLARELEGPPDALVAENPTRGLDIRATDLVRRQLRNARDAGLAVVTHSTDLDEVLALADRVLVVFAGKVREVAPDRELVGRAMLGAG